MKTQYRCKNEGRKTTVRTTMGTDGNPILNGIDYLEISSIDQNSMDQKKLTVHFIHNLPGQENPVPSGPVLTENNVIIEGGVRVKNIQIELLSSSNNILTLNLNTPGDFSIYTLRLVASLTESTPPAGFDPELSEVKFSFKVNCPNEFDCRSVTICPPERLSEPTIDYLTKDYASFRRLILDRLSTIMPDWKERNIADISVTLVELLAHVGDYLSYQQDAIATEAYLDTARSRISVRRHARLADYFMHDGCNARVWVQVQVNADTTLPGGTKLLTRIDGQPKRIPAYDQTLSQQEVFETMHTAHTTSLFNAHNKLHFYTWGARECCLPRGATHATLEGHYPNLNPGDVLIFTEDRSLQTSSLLHRHAVRLINIITKDGRNNDLTDPLNGQPITEIEWHVEDALPFPFCISAVIDEGGIEKYNERISVALGNIVLADHGLTIENDQMDKVPKLSFRFNPHLNKKPLALAVPYREDQSANKVIHYSAKDALPAITLESKLDGSIWMPKRDLLSSGPDEKEFVVEMERDGTEYLRFGDDQRGLRPGPETEFTATYRVGNGTRGNVGAETIVHIVSNDPAISGVCNPLPAQGGVEPETIEHARQSAPSAFRTQERAVTPEDYAEVAERHPQVERAAAIFRWTGSWNTVFMTIDRLGGLPIDEDFKKEMRTHIEKYRMAGHDIEIDGPHFVSLEIEIFVLVKPDYFRSDVKNALLQVFSNSVLLDGRRGVFHPDNFTFGQTVYLSPLYEAAHAVEGISSVQITRFQRLGIPGSEALEAGKLILGRLEIARLDNDPNFPENGSFRLIIEGGK